MLIVVAAEQSTEGSSLGAFFCFGKLEIPTPILDSLDRNILTGDIWGVVGCSFVWTFTGEAENFCLAQANINC